MVTSFILAFSGLSIQAQVASILAETDIRFKPYFFARIIKVFLPLFLLLYFGNHFMKSKLFLTYAKDIPVFVSNHSSILHEFWTSFIHYGPIFTLFCLYVYVILLFFEQQRKTPFTLTGFETFLLKHVLQQEVQDLLHFLHISQLSQCSSLKMSIDCLS